MRVMAGSNPLNIAKQLFKNRRANVSAKGMFLTIVDLS